jgi:hypothetical protein
MMNRRIFLALMATLTYDSLGVTPAIAPDNQNQPSLRCSCDARSEIKTLQEQHPMADRIISSFFRSHFDCSDNSDAPFELFKSMHTRYVLVSKLAQICAGSQYVVTMKKPGMYNVKNKDGLEGDLEELHGIYGENDMDFFYLLHGEKAKKPFDAAVRVHFKKEENGTSYKADFYVLPKNPLRVGLLKFASMVADLGSYYGQLFGQVIFMGAEVYQTMVNDPNGVLDLMNKNDEGIKFTGKERDYVRGLLNPEPNKQ